MDIISQIIQTFLYYLQELWLPLFFGFLVSGVCHELISQSVIDNHLSSKGIKPILIASTVGTILPVCCFGSLPIAVAFHKRGAKLGPILAFLVATPATSLSALFVSWKLLGNVFTIYIFFVVIIMGIVMGLVGNLLPAPQMTKSEESCRGDQGQCVCHPKTLVKKLKAIIKFAFVTMPKDIGWELLIGIVVASIISTVTPLQNIIQTYLSGIFGFVFSIVIGLATYVCSTASVPLVHAFKASGLNEGAAMTFLIVGPITSYGSMLVLRKKFGSKILLCYLATICILAVTFGALYSTLAFV